MSADPRPTTPDTAPGLEPGMRVWVGGRDTAAKRAIEAMLSGTARPPTGPVDAVFICPQTADEALYFAAKLLPRLQTGGAVWIVCGSERGATSDDLDRRVESVKSEIASIGMVGFSHRPISAHYVALGFRYRSR